MSVILLVKEEIFLCLVKRRDFLQPEPIVMTDEDNPVFRAEMQALDLARKSFDGEGKRVIKAFIVVKKFTANYRGHELANVKPIILRPTTYFGEPSVVSAAERRQGFSQFTHAADLITGGRAMLAPGERIMNITSGTIIHIEPS